MTTYTARVLRPPASVAATAIAASCLGAFVTTIVLAALGVAAEHREAFYVSVLIVAAICGLRASRVAVEVGDTSIVIKNVFRRYTIPWGEIVGVGIAHWWPSAVTLLGAFGCVFIETSDGKKRFIQASVGIGPDQAVVAELVARSRSTPWSAITL